MDIGAILRAIGQVVHAISQAADDATVVSHLEDVKASLAAAHKAINGG